MSASRSATRTQRTAASRGAGPTRSVARSQTPQSSGLSTFFKGRRRVVPVRGSIAGGCGVRMSYC